MTNLQRMLMIASARILGYDLNNLSPVQVTKSIAAQDLNPTGITFNNDGTKIFACGGENASIYEYNLSTGFDLSTKSGIQVTKSVISEDGTPQGIVFNNDGTKLFMIGTENASIYEYNLSTPFDLSTLSGVQVTKSVSSEDTGSNGLTFNNDGTKLFMVGEQNDSIYEYNLGTGFNLSTLSTVQVTETIPHSVPGGIIFNNSGSKIFTCGDGNIREYNLGTLFDLSTLSVVQVTKSVSSEDSIPKGIAFNNNGTKIFMVGSINDSIHEYNL